MVADFSLKEMVERVGWMSPIHYEILLFFEEHDIWISPRDLAKNIEYNREYVGRECRVLEKSGLLEKESQTYRLSELGHSFLAGDIDPADLSKPEG